MNYHNNLYFECIFLSFIVQNASFILYCCCVVVVFFIADFFFSPTVVTFAMIIQFPRVGMIKFYLLFFFPTLFSRRLQLHLSPFLFHNCRHFAPETSAPLHANGESPCRPDVLSCSPRKTHLQHHGSQGGQCRFDTVVVDKWHVIQAY